MMREENHVFQGMRRDNHPIKQDGKFLWDAHNIRFTIQDDNTFLSISNERGTKDTQISLSGFYVGHCVLGKYLVVFTGDEDYQDSSIYRVHRNEDDTYSIKVLYKDTDSDTLELSPTNPIEAIGVYENEAIQKVYWIDGYNQPRVINIVSDKEFTSKSFDFVPELSLEELVSVTRSGSHGQFSPGVIQYAFSYYNKYGQESNIFYVTGLNYISPEDRGARPDEIVDNSFSIRVTHLEYNQIGEKRVPRFDFLRVYSIHRTSLDAVPTVKIVADVELDSSGEEVEITDSGNMGEIIDPTRMLFVGGEDIVANAIGTKDSVLFLGNITIKRPSIPENIKALLSSEENAGDFSSSLAMEVPSSSSSSAFYSYSNSLSQGSTSYFKGGEHYRLGVQFQYKNGKWSEPVVLSTNYTISELYPRINDDGVTLPLLQYNYVYDEAFSQVIEPLKRLGYKRMRAIAVYPTQSDRLILAQGVLCPTVFNVLNRRKGTIYSQSSWFARLNSAVAFTPTAPGRPDGDAATKYELFGTAPEWRHFYSADNEIQKHTNYVAQAQNISEDNVEDSSSNYYIDQSVLTLHSPDVTFDEQLWNASFKGCKLHIVGVANFTASAGDATVQTSSPPIEATSTGIVDNVVGVRRKSAEAIRSLLYLDYVDYPIRVNGTGSDFYTKLSSHQATFTVYPWHRSGSLNNDSVRQEGRGSRSAVLKKKVISNLKFSDFNTWFTNVDVSETDKLHLDITTPSVFSSQEISLTKLASSSKDQGTNYYGNIDTMVSNREDYNVAVEGQMDDGTRVNATNQEPEFKTREPARIKYKSTPHIVTKLLGVSENKYKILPRFGDLFPITGTVPSWMYQGVGSSIERTPIHIWDSSRTFNAGTVRRGQKPTYDNFSPGTSYATADNYGKGFIYFEVTVNYGISGGGASGTGVHQVTTKCGYLYTVVRTNTGGRGNPVYSYSLSKVAGGSSSNDYTKLYVYNNKAYCWVGSNPGTLQEFSEAGDLDFQTREIVQDSLSITKPEYPYLFLAEIYREESSIKNPFGGDSQEQLKQNRWEVAGTPQDLDSQRDGWWTLYFTAGDTWYQRFDCLKTYPFTQEDENSIVEIVSFMCESHVNIDGRYDRNRGQLSNVNMSPQNFNLLNPVYSQKDNYFNYRILDKDFYNQNDFQNQLTWSMQKLSGDQNDAWTNITLANTFDLDGAWGKIVSIDTFQDNIYCFQEKALNQLLFNSRVQIPASDGVPIEISNGQRMEGNRLISSTIGCSNKWSIITTPMGIYFIDSNTQAIYLFNGQITNLSDTLGMRNWVLGNHTSKQWAPISYARGNRINGIRTFYDASKGDVYFVPGYDYTANVRANAFSAREALCYSEKLQQFTSFTSYGGTPAMFNLGDKFLSIHHFQGEDEYVQKLWENNAGRYNEFFGERKPFSISFISNGDPLYTKIFDTVELRADSYTDDVLNAKFPFTHIYSENEYQKSGDVSFSSNAGMLRKKFRVWRAQLPRVADTSKGARRSVARSRLRNPWTMVTLSNQDKTDYNRAVIHDLTVKYTL